MARKIKLTEEQYQQMLSEVTIQGVTTNGKADTNATATAIQQSGANPNNVNVSFKGTEMTGSGSGSTSTSQQATNEHRIVTKKELQANRLRYLKEHSEVYSLNNFLSKLR